MQPLAHRSQVILRMPVDAISAALILHDGERCDVMLFVPTGQELARMLADEAPFMPVVHKGRIMLVARSTVAAIGMPRAAAGDVPDDGLPHVEQKVRVKLRSAVLLEGALRWVGPDGKQRTTDHLNHSDASFELHDETTTYLVIKQHVATVTEC